MVTHFGRSEDPSNIAIVTGNVRSLLFSQLTRVPYEVAIMTDYYFVCRNQTG